MIQCVDNIVVPHVDKRESLGEDKAAVIILLMDNFKGQVTPKMNALLK